MLRAAVTTVRGVSSKAMRSLFGVYAGVIVFVALKWAFGLHLLRLCSQVPTNFAGPFVATWNVALAETESLA